MVCVSLRCVHCVVCVCVVSGVCVKCVHCGLCVCGQLFVSFLGVFTVHLCVVNGVPM